MTDDEKAAAEKAEADRKAAGQKAADDKAAADKARANRNRQQATGNRNRNTVSFAITFETDSISALKP